MNEGIGARLREARTAAGLSLSEMAKRTCYSRGYLSNVENGTRRVSPDIVLAYERALADGNEMHRRQLLTGMAASMVASAAMAELLHGAFSRMLGPAVSTEEWWDRSQSYGRAYMTLGAGELSNRLAADMVQVQRSADDPAVWAPASCLMTVYGKTLPTNGGRKGAINWYQLAAVVADRSGDLPTRVWVRGRAALALAYEGAEPAIAGRWAEQAIALSENASMGRLNALLARMHVMAARGDRAETQRALDAARREFDRSGSYEQESDFAMPEWRFAIHESMLYSRLGDERATEAQDTVDRLRPASLARFGTHVELHRGLMLARAGDSSAGLDHARAALDRLPAGKRSLSLQLMMAEVERAATGSRRS